MRPYERGFVYWLKRYYKYSESAKKKAFAFEALENMRKCARTRADWRSVVHVLELENVPLHSPDMAIATTGMCFGEEEQQPTAKQSLVQKFIDRLKIRWNKWIGVYMASCS